MLRPDVSRRANKDLIDLWAYIAKDNVDAADRMHAEIRAAIERLCEFPGAGHRLPEITRRPLLFWTVSPYIIVYQRQGRRLRIVRVVHGRRDLGAVFR